MDTENRWLLPDGVDELLPEHARATEMLRRKLLDLAGGWGYELVIPSLIEFTESLLIGHDHELDVKTFRVTDRISGRMLGIRADITPQVARIDAHSLKSKGVSRLCYAGSVLHTLPKHAQASRSPIQLGAELYGVEGVEGDIEIVSLMLDMLTSTGVKDITLDLGHVGLFNALVNYAQLSYAGAEYLQTVLQTKSHHEISECILSLGMNEEAASLLWALNNCSGTANELVGLSEAFLPLIPDTESVFQDVQCVVSVINERYPDVIIHVDLAEPRGFHYYTGLVFSALSTELGEPVANGGRYDDIGAVFGRARAATGFNTDLKPLLKVVNVIESKPPLAIFVEADIEPFLWAEIKQLRQQGEVVIVGLCNEHFERYADRCDRELILNEGASEVLLRP